MTISRGRLAVGVLQLLALALDPGQPLDDGQADVLVVEASRRGDADPAERRVDADVQVLDVLVDDIDVDAARR